MIKYIHNFIKYYHDKGEKMKVKKFLLATFLVLPFLFNLNPAHADDSLDEASKILDDFEKIKEDDKNLGEMLEEGEREYEKNIEENLELNKDLLKQQVQDMEKEVARKNYLISKEEIQELYKEIDNIKNAKDFIRVNERIGDIVGDPEKNLLIGKDDEDFLEDEFVEENQTEDDNETSDKELTEIEKEKIETLKEAIKKNQIQANAAKLLIERYPKIVANFLDDLLDLIDKSNNLVKTAIYTINKLTGEDMTFHPVVVEMKV
jgi:hypothetical protein